MGEGLAAPPGHDFFRIARLRLRTERKDRKLLSLAETFSVLRVCAVLPRCN